MATGGVAAAAATSWADDLSTLDQLFAEARAYRFTKEYRELITFIGRFPNYAPYNCFLLHTQNPGVQYVLNAKQWRERFRRCVVDGAGPLVVLVRFGPVDFVYDLLDTTGPEVPPAALDPFRAVGDLPQTAWDMTIGNCERDLVKVVDISAHTNRAGSIGTAEPEDTVWGIVKTNKGAAPTWGQISAKYRLRVNKGHLLPTRYATLAHELAHLYCGHLGTPNPKW